MERERSKGNFVTRMSSQERKLIAKSTLLFGGMTMLLQFLSDVNLKEILVAGILDAIAGLGIGTIGVFAGRKINSKRK